MNRREFVQWAGAVSAGLAIPPVMRGAAADGWRTFEVTTRIEVLSRSAGATRVWAPAGIARDTPFQKTLSNGFDAEGGTARLDATGADALGILAADSPRV